MMSTKLSYFLPPPLSALGSDFYYKIQATFLTTSAISMTPLPLQCGHHIYKLPWGGDGLSFGTHYVHAAIYFDSTIEP